MQLARKSRPKKRSSLVSIGDVAHAAGVSLGTVSRVMNQEANVRPELVRRVLIEARQIGFVPRAQQHHLAIVTGRHNPVLPTGYTDIMASLLERLASRRGFTIQVVDEERLETAYDCRISAAIGVVSSDRIEQLLEVPNLPLITVNHPMQEKGIHSIYSDHFEQGLRATQYLLEKGHRKIALLQEIAEEWGAKERRRGFEAAMTRAGLNPEPMSMFYSGSAPVYDILQRWLRHGYTAILNLSEDLVPEVLHILSNVFSRRIGRDVSTITLEDLPIYQYFSPPQTVIRQPLEAMARLAVEKAEALAFASPAQDDGVMDLCLPGELVERDSVATLPHSPAERAAGSPKTSER